ncbi:hypothetical protein OAV88_01725 [bacterium]|nr:hypothetical protein [bacterium]
MCMYVCVLRLIHEMILRTHIMICYYVVNTQRNQKFWPRRTQRGRKMVRTRSSKRVSDDDDDDDDKMISGSRKVEDVDSSSDDEAPEMVDQSQAKEMERRRIEFENSQRARYVFFIYLRCFLYMYIYIIARGCLTRFMVL